MAKVTVIAKVTGTHAVTGLGLVAGNEYEIDEEHYGDEIFERKKNSKDPKSVSSTEQEEA